MLKSLLILCIFILFTDYNYSQVYSNVSESYTQQINFNYDISEIKQLDVEVPNIALTERKKKEGVFATNINVDIDLIGNSNVYEVANNRDSINKIET